jgi:hypothetical protein
MEKHSHVHGRYNFVCKDVDDDDDLVDGVRLRLLTAATNGTIVHPQMIYERAELK